MERGPFCYTYTAQPTNRQNSKKGEVMSVTHVLISVFLSTNATADIGTYKLPVVRNGVTYTQLAGNFWQGEYPGPVIDVKSKKKAGTTTIKAWTSLRVLDQAVNCTIRNGLYHPWADINKSKNSVINFYTITGYKDVEVVAALPENALSYFHDNEGQALNVGVGDKIINEFYLSEGISMATLVKNGKETTIYLTAGISEDFPEYFKTIGEQKSLVKQVYDDEIYYAAEQWLYLKCNEGYNAFVRDTDLLSQKGITEGQVTGWGEIEGSK